MAHFGYALQESQLRAAIAAARLDAPTLPGFWVVCWNVPRTYDGTPWNEPSSPWSPQARAFTDRESAEAHFELLQARELPALIANSDFDTTLRSRAVRSAGMLHSFIQHSGSTILKLIDERHPRKQRHRRLVRGVLRAVLVLVVMRREAAQRVYAPGGCGFEEAQHSFARCMETQSLGHQG